MFPERAAAVEFYSAVSTTNEIHFTSAVEAEIPLIYLNPRDLSENLKRWKQNYVLDYVFLIWVNWPFKFSSEQARVQVSVWGGKAQKQ